MYEWVEYTGEYEKEFYDIQLKDGTVCYKCYPNAGTFHFGREIIDGNQVAKIRLVYDPEFG